MREKIDKLIITHLLREATAWRRLDLNLGSLSLLSAALPSVLSHRMDHSSTTPPFKWFRYLNSCFSDPHLCIYIFRGDCRDSRVCQGGDVESPQAIRTRSTFG